MKKIITLLLFLLTLLLLCACSPEISPQTPPDNGAGGGDVESESAAEENDDYLHIQCRYVATYKNEHFAFRASHTGLTFSVPEDWVFAPLAENYYTVSRGGAEIGFLYAGTAADLGDWTCVNQQITDANGVRVTQCIDKYGTKETLRFRYRYVYTYVENDTVREITLVTDYAEISIHGSFLLFFDVVAEDIRKDALFSTLQDAKDGSILIMGNSFIGSSRIGSILNEMMQGNGKNATVTAYARGYARVHTYTDDPTIMADIENGKYDAIFICGLYGADEISNLGIMQEACAVSGTEMVVFPAHNEPRDHIEKAKEKYPSMIFFDWKAEIDALIATGIDKWAFCVDDQHLHTTALGGYVGAHMIYRAMYSEVPATVPYWSAPADVYDLLSDYAATGYATPPNLDWVHFLG